MANEVTTTADVKTLTVPQGSDTRETAAETESILDSLQSFADKKQSGETEAPVTPPARVEKNAAPATDDQKKELEGILGDGHTEPAKPKTETPRGEDGKFVKQEKVEEAKVEKTETKPAKTPPKFEDLSPDGINREVDSLKTNKAETKERYAALLVELKHAREAGDMTKKEYDAAKAELAAAKQASEAASKKVETPPEELARREQEASELAMLRRQYQLEKDPELKVKFDDRVEAVEKSIIQTLTEAEVPPKAVELIQKSGGWMAFSRSKEPIKWHAIDPTTGETVVQSGTRADYARNILNAIDPAAAATVNARTGEQVNIRDSKDRFVAEEKAKAKDFFSKKEEEWKNQSQATQNKLKELQEAYGKWVDQTASTDEALKDRVVPDKATAEQRAEIEAHNKSAKEIRDYVRGLSTTTSMDQYTELVKHAIRGRTSEPTIKGLTTKLEEATKRSEALQQELDKVRKAGSTITRPGSVTSRSEGIPTPKKAQGGLDDIMADLEKMVEDKAS